MNTNPARRANILTATASELQAHLTFGRFTSVDLVRLCRQHILYHDGYLRAMISQAPGETVLTRARLLDDERKQGKVRGPLHGLPIVVKDNIATHPSLGMKTTAGNFALAESVVKRNAEVIDLLLEAGLIIIGKTNMTELSGFKGEGVPSGWSAVGGQANSAYMPEGLQEEDIPVGHTNPSGSSTGSATSVSAGYAPFSLGTESSGSLVSPANRAALYTLRTHGLVSTKGVVPISTTFDAVGPIAKSVEDLVNLFQVMVGPQTAESLQLQISLATDWSDCNVATLNPQQWIRHPKPAPEPDMVTRQMIYEINDAYARIRRLSKGYHHHVNLPPAENYWVDDKSATWHLMQAEFPSALNAYLSDELEESPVRSLQELIDWNTAHSEIELPAGKGDQSHLISAAATTSDAAEITAMRDKLRGQAATLALDPLFSNLSLPPINHHHHHNKPTTATTKAKEEEEEREENHRYRLDALLGPADSALPDYAAAAGYAIATLPLGRFHPRLGRPGANGGGRPYGLVAIGAPGADGLRRLVKVASAWEASWQARAVPDLEGLPHRRTV